MSRLQVSADQSYFEKDGKQFFIMADTCWSAFTNMTFEEWKQYLILRKEQGFNAIQINVLPQWDRGIADGEEMVPFLKTGKTEITLEDIPEEYIRHSEVYLEQMKEMELVPILVLLWANYTKGTFFDNLWGKMPMKKEDVQGYVKMIAARYAKYEPVYFISGDTSFSDEVVDDYYLPALNALKATDPEALASLHICGDGFLTTREVEETIPERLLYHSGIDFYIYQSGHYDGWINRCTACAKAFRGLKVRKPVFNAEPCYEGWDIENGSHEVSHMNQSTWHSILSGGDAGLSYGGQGIWMWQREGDFFAPSVISDQPILYKCLPPFKAWEAMEFPGARHRTFARFIMEHYGIRNVLTDDRFEAPYSYTRLATSNEGKRILLYVPRSQKTRVHIPAEGMKFELYSLYSLEKTEARIIVDEDGFTLDYETVLGDFLLIGSKE